MQIQSKNEPNHLTTIRHPFQAKDREPIGEDEVLLDDSRRYAQRVVAAGGVAELHIWEDMTHVFPSSVGTFAASEMALENVGAFLYQSLR